MKKCLFFQKEFKPISHKTKVLFTGLCQTKLHSKKNEGLRKQQLSTRLLDKRFQKNTPHDSSKGQFDLCGLWYKGEKKEVKRRVLANQSLRSSYRSQENKQYPSKFNNVVSPMPMWPHHQVTDKAGRPSPISRVEFSSNSKGVCL